MMMMMMMMKGKLRLPTDIHPFNCQRNNAGLLTLPQQLVLHHSHVMQFLINKRCTHNNNALPTLLQLSL